jgi:plastocyanin
MMKRMRERGTRRKKLAVAGALVVAIGLLAAGLAFGAAPIIGQGDDTYSAPTYTIDQGEVGQLQVTGSTHNVTARQSGPDGQALFRTPTISGGSTGVQGTQFLSAGDYTFFCTVHPTTMQATLHVTSNGAPQARPSAQLSVRSKKLAKVAKKGILVALTTTAKVDGASLVAKLGKTTIGKADGLSLAAGQQFATVRLSKAGKNALKKKSKASVTVTATIPFGTPATGKSKLT